MRAAAESAVVGLENVAKRPGAGARIWLTPGACHFLTGGAAAPIAMAQVTSRRRLACLA